MKSSSPGLLFYFGRGWKYAEGLGQSVKKKKN